MYSEYTNNHHKEKETYRKRKHNKRITKKYNITPQTAYHISQLALAENITEGKIIDKLMVEYLSSFKQY